MPYIRNRPQSMLGAILVTQKRLKLTKPKPTLVLPVVARATTGSPSN